MANPKHLEILKQGVNTWNRWRISDLKFNPDLSNCDLSGLNLEKINFSNTNLSNSDLSRTSLVRANFTSANLKKATFRNSNLYGSKFVLADLSKSTLIDVDLTKSNLSRTDFTQSFLSNLTLIEAVLTGTIFRYTYLDRVNFSNSVMYDTLFSNTDLTLAIGLNFISHGGPNSIDHHTLWRSENLPIEFLRGCGLPNELIDLILIPKDNPIQFYSCFISYSSKDQAFAKRLHADLQNSGLRCWFAPEDLKIGEKIRHAIDDAIKYHDKLLLIISENSIDSDWVENEVETAIEKESKSRDNKTVLFPIRLDDSVMETANPWAGTIKRTRHIGDFTNWKDHDSYQRAFERLLRDLKKT